MATQPTPAIDLSLCDQEPIHLPGSIQPHGLLLVLQSDTLDIIGGAGAIETRLAADWQKRPASEMLGQDLKARLDASPDHPTIVLDPVSGRGEIFDAMAHRAGDRVLVELEPVAAEAPSAIAMLATLEAVGAAFDRASDLRELCQRAAAVYRQLTGFDRVMIYRFLDDDAGVVIAEDRDAALGCFLNHHFPATDIPKQARVLYVRNRIRVIPDVSYRPEPIRPESADWTTLDLSDLALRSVSPIHVQYLKNMRVGASASISIVKDGVLWGLIACHHRTPKLLSMDTRIACRALAGGLARQISAKDIAEDYRERLRLRAAEDTVVTHLDSDESLAGFLADTGPELCRMLGADGFAAAQGPDLYLTGHCPDRADIRDIAAWVRDRAIGQPFSSHFLSGAFPAAKAFDDLASGLMAITLSTEEPIVLLWFRAEQIEVVNWAGNPHKAVTADPDAVLTPRASFQAWTEAVRGRSRPWTLAEIEAASRLLRILLDARQNHRIRQLNRQLAATVADMDTLIMQKDFLVKEVNHRVQNSLQLVSAFLALQARASGDAALSGHLNEAQRRLSAVALVHARLYRDDRVGTVDLARYIEDLCADMRVSMGAEWADQISLDLAPVLIPTDRAVNVGLILTELVINANKYAYDGAPGPISIVLEQHRNRLRLIVADRGHGKTNARRGFGTRMLSAMVQQLAGNIEDVSNEPGLRVIVMAPIEAAV